MYSEEGEIGERPKVRFPSKLANAALFPVAWSLLDFATRGTYDLMIFRNELSMPKQLDLSKLCEFCIKAVQN